MKSLFFYTLSPNSGEFCYGGAPLIIPAPDPNKPIPIGAPRYVGITPYFPDATPIPDPTWNKVIATIRALEVVARVQVGHTALLVTLKEGNVWPSGVITNIADLMWSAIDADTSVAPEKRSTERITTYVKKEIA